MKIEQSKHDEIMHMTGELRDGVTVSKNQFQHVLDVHSCHGVYAEGDAFYFVTEYKLKDEFDNYALFNFSCVDGVKFDMYDEVSVTVYDVKDEMQQHLLQFLSDNHL